MSGKAIAEEVGGPEAIRRVAETGELSAWLDRSEAVVALAITPDGELLWRNDAAAEFLADSAPGEKIWPCFLNSDAQLLSAAIRGNTPGAFVLHVADGMYDPVALELSILPLADTYLLLGALEQRSTRSLHKQLREITHELVRMTRELSRKNAELERANERVHRLAAMDELTSLANRRKFYQSLTRELSRGDRAAEPLSVVMMDVDRFKRINDRFGHIAGDAVLRRMGSIIGSQTRPYDLAARYGGEEFALLLRKTDLAGAVTVAQRLCRDVRLANFEEVGTAVTISAGVATWQHGEAAESLLRRADAALYRCKAVGGDRVEQDG